LSVHAEPCSHCPPLEHYSGSREQTEEEPGGVLPSSKLHTGKPVSITVSQRIVKISRDGWHCTGAHILFLVDWFVETKFNVRSKDQNVIYSKHTHTHTHTL